MLFRSSRNFLVSGGTLTGTVLTTLDGATLQVAGNVTLDAVTLNADLDLGGQSISVLNGLTLNRTLGMYNDSAVYFSGGSQTLAGTGTVDFRGTYRQALVANADNATLTIGSGITVRGGNRWIGDDYTGSVIGYNRWAGGGDNVSVVNLGTIIADAAGRGIVINPRGSGTFATGSGTIKADNGGHLYVNATTGDMSQAILAGASRMVLNGTYTLGSRINLSPGQTLELNGNYATTTGFAVDAATLRLGGTWSATNTSIDVTNGGSLTFTTSGATLDRSEEHTSELQSH